MPADPTAPLGWNLVLDVRQLFEFPFMVNAFRAGTIVAVVAGSVGWFVVLRRQAFAAHTLALVGFPGASAAVWLGASATLGYVGGCGAAALAIAGLSRNPARNQADESAGIGVIQVFALACGFLFVSLYGGFLNGVNALLFGTFLGITAGEVAGLLVVGVAAVVLLIAIGRPLLFASVDVDVAEASGLRVQAISVAFLFLLALTVAEISQITGSLLVFALLVMPAATAQSLTARPAQSLALSVAIAVGITWAGLAMAYYSVYPIGFFISSIAFAGYLAAASRRRIMGRHYRPARRTVER